MSLLGNIRLRGLKETCCPRERETVDRDRGGGFDVILLVLQMLRRSDTPETGSGENSNSAAQVLAVGDAV